jgi:transcriptional regulator with XRE-family HTH domain
MTTKGSYFEKLEKTYGPLTFGSLLKSFRQADDISQVEFAKKLGLSRQNVSDLESGRRIPSSKRASKIAKKLGLPETALIKLAIQDSLNKDGFKLEVNIKSA